VGRSLIIIGAVIVLVGIVLSLVPIRLGRLPGDIVIRGKNSVFYFPLATSLLVSLILSFLLWLFRR
jgi:DUF2905 family protein